MRDIDVIVDTDKFQAEMKRSGNGAVPPIQLDQLAAFPQGWRRVRINAQSCKFLIQSFLHLCQFIFDVRLAGDNLQRYVAGHDCQSCLCRLLIPHQQGVWVASDAQLSAPPLLPDPHAYGWSIAKWAYAVAVAGWG